MEAYWPEAIVIVGLGDCAPGNTRHIDLLAERLRERYGHPIVEACAMTPRRPQLSEAFAKCINRSARRIPVVPYAFELDTDDFSVLAMAVHEVSRKLEGVRVFIGEPIGLDDSLVRLVDQRVRESSELPDIRELSFVKEQERGNAL